jgi:hypothetical protein
MAMQTSDVADHDEEVKLAGRQEVDVVRYAPCTAQQVPPWQALV